MGCVNNAYSLIVALRFGKAETVMRDSNISNTRRIVAGIMVVMMFVVVLFSALLSKPTMTAQGMTVLSAPAYSNVKISLIRLAMGFHGAL